MVKMPTIDDLLGSLGLEVSERATYKHRQLVEDAHSKRTAANWSTNQSDCRDFIETGSLQ